MLDLKNKKTKLLIGLGCAGGVMALSGVGVGVGYAIWHQNQKKADTIIDGPTWDLNAFESFSTWELATTSNALENPTSCKVNVQYNVAGLRERKDNKLSWFKENLLSPKLPFEGSPTYMNGFVDETTINEDKGMQKDLFSYRYAKTPKICADGTALVDGKYLPISFVYAHSDKNQSTGKVTSNVHVQNINFSPSFIFDPFVVGPDLLTITHSDNRALTDNPRNNIKHEYQLDFWAMSGANEIAINFRGKLLQLLSEGIDGGMEALNFQLTTADVTYLNGTWDYDQDTHDFKFTLSEQNLIIGRRYRIYMNWLHSI